MSLRGRSSIAGKPLRFAPATSIIGPAFILDCAHFPPRVSPWAFCMWPAKHRELALPRYARRSPSSGVAWAKKSHSTSPSPWTQLQERPTRGCSPRSPASRKDDLTLHPYTGGKLDPTLGEALKAEVNVLKKENDAVIVQGLPATDAQGTQLEASAAMAQKLDCPVLGILSFDPEQEPAFYEGTAKHWRETFGELLVGLVLNRCTRYASHLVESQVSSAISNAGTHLLATIPEDRSMLAPTVAQVAKHLDAPAAHRAAGAPAIGGAIHHWRAHHGMGRQLLRPVSSASRARTRRTDRHCNVGA